MINWFTDNLVRALSLITPSYFSEESLVATITKLREKSRDELLKLGVVVESRTSESNKKTEILTFGDNRLYPHESSEMRKDKLIFKFRFDDITRPAGELYAHALVEIDSEGNVLKSESNL